MSDYRHGEPDRVREGKDDACSVFLRERVERIELS
jgi:hypothetical protein